MYVFQIEIIKVIYGIWTLDLLRYIVPPFCVSEKLKLVHIFYLQWLSIIFPYFLIATTWLLIHLHSRDCKVVVWMWNKLRGIILKHFKVKRNSDRTVVNAFATFFFLTFVKISLFLLTSAVPLIVFQVNNFNHSTSHRIKSYISEDYTSAENLVILVATVGIYPFTILSPIIIIALYPLQPFRKLLLKCCCRRFICTLNCFTEKFYSCYRDGLDGGRDMRSFASVHFITALFLFVVWSMSYSFIVLASTLGGCSLLIAIVRPYKKRHMVVIESLILANGAFVLATSANASTSYQIVSQISATFPALGFIIFIFFKISKKPCLKLYPKLTEKMSILTVRQCVNSCLKRGHNQEENVQEVEDNEVEIQLPDRVVHPEDYERVETINTAY